MLAIEIKVCFHLLTGGAMTPAQVFVYFRDHSAAKRKSKSGRPETAAALDVSYQAVQQWHKGNQVPDKQQLIIEKLTEGALVADPSITKSNPKAA
jgi:hypothetical protein